MRSTGRPCPASRDSCPGFSEAVHGPRRSRSGRASIVWREFDSRDALWPRILPFGQRSGPVLRRRPEGVQGDAVANHGKTGQPPQSRLEQRACAARIAPRIVVKGCRDLDNSLQKGFLRLGRAQPDLFPSLVGIEKAAGVKLLDPPAQRRAMWRRADRRLVLWRVRQFGSEPRWCCAQQAPRGSIVASGGDSKAS